MSSWVTVAPHLPMSELTGPATPRPLRPAMGSCDAKRSCAVAQPRSAAAIVMTNTTVMEGRRATILCDIFGDRLGVVFVLLAGLSGEGGAE